MPKTISGWLTWGAFQLVLTFLWKVVVALALNAMLGWGDEQIASLLGITSPSFRTIVNWAVPLMLAGITLVIYHWIQIQFFRAAVATPQADGKSRALSAIVSINPLIPGALGILILLISIGLNSFQGTPSDNTIAPPSGNSTKSDSLSPIFHLNDAKRYQLVKGLRTALPRTTCHTMLHTKPRSEWAANAWSELSEILFVANWWLEGARTTSAFFPNGITLFSSKDTGDGFSCAFRLSEMLVSINNRPTFRDNQTTPDLAACEKENPTHGCVEILIGEAPQ